MGFNSVFKGLKLQVLCFTFHYNFPWPFSLQISARWWKIDRWDGRGM